MPIDSSPEGGEVMHQPMVKPFPEATPIHQPAAQKHHEAAVPIEKTYQAVEHDSNTRQRVTKPSP